MYVNSSQGSFARFCFLMVLAWLPVSQVQGAADFVQISAGYRHTVGLRANGSLVAYGATDYGQSDVGSFSDVVQISAGSNTTAILASDGTVHATGWNKFGQCKVQSWSEIVQVSAGFHHTVGLRSDGTVVVTGYFHDGRDDVDEWEDIVQVAAGEITVGLQSGGRVVAVGPNEHGQREVDAWSDIVQVAAGRFHTVALRSDGTVLAVGANDHGQCDVDLWSDIVQVSAGIDHTVALRMDGTVVCTGSNASGQCDTASWGDIIQVAAGDDKTLGLKADGTVVAVGSNAYNQLGLSHWRFPDIAAGGFHSVVLHENGTVSARGYNLSNPCEVDAWNDIVQVAAAMDKTVGLRGDGTVVGAGHDADPSLQIDHWTEIALVDCGPSHTIGLKEDHTAIAAGHDITTTYDVSAWDDLVDVSAGTDHLLGVKSNGTVVGVGSNAYGELNFSPWNSIVRVSAGHHFTIGLRVDGLVLARGLNDEGQCDVNDWRDVVQVATGTRHTVGLLSDGTVVATGLNDWGQCDVRSWKNIVRVSAGESHTLGITADGTIMATGHDNYGQCRVRTIPEVAQIVAGEKHTLGLRSNGTVLAVGQNSVGQCDVDAWEDIYQIESNRETSVALDPYGNLSIVGYNSTDETPRLYPDKWFLVGGWAQISAGPHHSLLLHSTLFEGSKVSVTDWSLNDGETIDGWINIAQVAAGTSHSVGLKQDGTVVAAGTHPGDADVSLWQDIVQVTAGWNTTYGLTSQYQVVGPRGSPVQVLPWEDWSNIVQISAGSEHIVGLRADGRVFAAGNNDSGECDVENWSQIVQVSAGNGYTLGLQRDGTVVTAGRNDYGQGDVSTWDLINREPEARDDTFETREGFTLSGNILENDFDEDGEPLEWILESEPAHGTLSLLPDGSFTYVPEYDSYGPDRFTYRLWDGMEYSRTATVSIMVENLPEAPQDILLSNNNLPENNLPNAVIGTLATVDPDSPGVFTYELVPGDGDADNARFEIDGNQLMAVNPLDFEEHPVFHIRIRSTDSLDQWIERTIRIRVRDVDEPPTDILISNTRINEGVQPGTEVGSLSVVDPELDDVYTISLQLAQPGGDNIPFIVDGNKLLTAGPLDFETISFHELRVEAVDEEGTRIEKTILVRILDENEAPTAIEFEQTIDRLIELAKTGTHVGVLTATDPDAGDSVHFSVLLPDGSPHDTFTVEGNILKTSAPLDYETVPVHTLWIRAIDTGGLSIDQIIQIQVHDSNEPPVDILLSNATVPENTLSGTVIGSFSMVDPDPWDSGQFSFVEPTPAFAIDGYQLRVVTPLDFEQQSAYPIQVRACDSFGKSVEKSFLISVTDINEAPDNFQLSNDTFNSDTVPGSVIARLGASDPEGGNLAFQLVEGNGSEHNHYFAIDGTDLLLSSPIDFHEDRSLSIRIRIGDPDGMGMAIICTIKVVHSCASPWCALMRVDGWKQTPFGPMDDSAFPWILHQYHGWGYCASESPDILHFYDLTIHCWWWAADPLYPLIYKHGNNSGWYLYIPDTANPDRTFYSYDRGEMIHQSEM